MFVSASICILVSITIQLIANVETKTAFRIDSFNDIVQNITHINSVLQEFIKNYKQLQDIYKSVELTAKDDVSDYVKRNKEFKFDPRSTTKPTHPTSTTTKQLTITPVFYSEEHHWRDTYDDNYYLDPKPMKNKVSNHALKLKSGKKIRPLLTTTTKTVTKKKAREPVTLDEPSKEKQRESNELRDSDVENQYNFNMPKTNRLIQSHETKERQDVKKVIKYETFDEDMWDSIIQSRPIKYDYPKNSLRRMNNINKKKTAVVYVTNLKNLNNKAEAKVDHLKKIILEESNSIPDDIVSSEMTVENAILRAKGKFGNACFRYVVRRCFLALNEAGKKTCKELGCRKKFRSTIKHEAKDACQNEFYGQMENKTKSFGKIGEETDEEDKIFKDLTRRKHQHDNLPNLGPNYLSTCYPHMLPAAKRMQLDSADLPESFLQAIASAEIPNQSQEKSILRNKYEIACRKESAKRCKKAGRRAISMICEKFTKDCKKKTKREFKKLTSKFCMEAFGVKKKIGDDDYEASCSSDDESSQETESDPFD